MQIDLQKIGLPLANFQFAVTCFCPVLLEKLLWKTSDCHCQLVVVFSSTTPSLPFSLFSADSSYNSPFSGRVTLSVALLSSFYLFPSVLFLMDSNPHSLQVYAIIS